MNLKKVKNHIVLFIIICISFLTHPVNAQQENLSFDLSITPFSYRGAYTCFTQYNGRNNPPKELSLHQISRRGKRIDYFVVKAIKNGKEVRADIIATPGKLILKSDEGNVEICYQSADIIRFRGNGLGIRLMLKGRHYLLPLDDKRFRLLSRDGSARFAFANLYGKSKIIQNDKEQKKHFYEYNYFQYDIEPDKDNKCEFALEEYLVDWRPKTYTKSFDRCLKDVQQQLDDWFSTMPDVPVQFKETTQLAMYLNWSSVVQPRGWIKHEGMLMSKTWMNGIWSWDNCFNAIATSFTDPELAWDQIQVVFENQQPNGALPDGTFENNLGLGYRKPPIYGWTLTQMEEFGFKLSREQMIDFYPKLVYFTMYWFNFRDDDGDGIPEYHHGNDSGWDNGTVFDMGFPAESPDLCAFLIIQMDYLSKMAKRLGRVEESREWQENANKLQEIMIDELWSGEKFLHKKTITGEYNENSICALSYMPLVLGKRLPEKISKKMVQNLKKDLITDYGIATESPKSDFFREDGYWRGPIWAPESYLIISGLDKMGEKELARELALKFCELCKNGSFAENFNAVTGQALVDPAYTWTSSTYLAFAKKYLK